MCVCLTMEKLLEATCDCISTNLDVVETILSHVEMDIEAFVRMGLVCQDLRMRLINAWTVVRTEPTRKFGVIAPDGSRLRGLRSPTRGRQSVSKGAH